MRNLNVPETADRIASWIGKYVDDSGCGGVVLGISGGIDSALVGALSVKALGTSNVHGMIIDVESSEDDLETAVRMAEHLGIVHEVMYLTPTLGTMDGAHTFGQGDIRDKVARANLKSRLRMCSLYLRANEMNRLVIGTTNLTEAVIGYYTKYGDGGVDLEPIIHLTKGEVREVARHLGVPAEIVNRTPSAGLWEGQTDESELGVSYDQMDEAITNYEGTKGTAAHDLVWGRYIKHEHKRIMPPGFQGIVIEE